ncbi:FAD/NAD-P-binding domain-containing protein [Daedaleopsis nitida]|nr:FAD/NAD-P-binding domain-containing protein [Daedaleopsis nitida]
MLTEGTEDGAMQENSLLQVYRSICAKLRTDSDSLATGTLSLSHGDLFNMVHQVEASCKTTPRIAIVDGGGTPPEPISVYLGGTLDLGWTSGQRALRENGLQEEVDKHSRPEGQEMKIGNAEGNIIFSRGREGAADPEKKRPEIDRSVLRKLLLDAVPSESVKWGHPLTSARALGPDKHELTFSNGATVQCDILVGADGANSRVQPLVSPATPIYSGITGAEISIAPEIVAQDDLKAIRELVGQGSLFSLGSNKFLGAQMNGDGRIRTYAWFRGPEDWRLPQTPNEVRRVLFDTYAPEGWSPTLLQLIERCDDAAICLRPLYYLPVAHTWEHVRGVTLVGDAAHLMTPFAGGAANIGMLDGLELGLALVDAIAGGKTDEEREAAIAAFEKTMFERAEKMAVFANANMEAFFRPDAAKAIVERAKAVIKEGMPGHKANAA